MAVHDRQSNDEIAHAERAEGDDRALQRDDRPRAPEGGGVGKVENASGDGRIGLNQADEVANPEVVALQQANDRQRDALRRWQLPHRFQRA